MSNEVLKISSQTSEAALWRQVTDIFLETLEQPRNLQVNFLQKICDGDEKLIQQVKDLLDSHYESEDFIENPVFDVGEIFESEEQAVPGKKIGNYRLVRELGRGGMGTVFLATRADGEFEQQSALKIVTQNFAGGELSKRFRRERQILANLNHPNIARLLDGGISRENQSYLVMEYVEGERIDDYCRKKNLSVEERLKIFLSVCSAVAYAHQNLVVHRDIKPSNILVTNEATPKLLDFGIAKLLDAENTGEQTRTNLRAFTPEYASPEQKEGGQITTATDIYSLGVLLNGLIVKKSKKAEKVKSELKSILQMAQREEPERRYASVQQFAEDIERFLGGQAVRAQKGSFTYRAGKFIRRNRLAFSAVVIIFLILTVGLTLSLYQYRNAERERGRAEKIRSFLENMINSANPITKSKVRPDSVQEFTAVLDDASRQIESANFDGEPEVKANLQQIIGNNYLSIGKYDLAEKNLQAALSKQHELNLEKSPAALKSRAGLAELEVIRSDYSTAERIYPQLLRDVHDAYKNEHVGLDVLILTLYDFALVCRAQGNSKQAENLLREIISYEEKANEFEGKQIEISKSVLILTLTDQGEFEEAQGSINSRIADLQKRSNPEKPEYAAMLTMLGSIQVEKGETADANANLKQAEKIYRQIFDPSYLPLYDNLRLQAQNLYLEGNYSEAEKTINTVLENYQKNSSSKYINYASALMVHGLILNKQGKFAQAESVLREAVRLRQENLPKQHFLSALTTGALGEFLTSQKRFEEAEALLNESCQILRMTQATENPRTILAKKRLEELYSIWKKPN